jgi:hypothetical protein
MASMITSAGATSDGGGEEGGGDQGGDDDQGGGGEEQGETLEETAPPETDDGTQSDTETDDDQQIPTPETSPTDPLAIAATPTVTPAPTSNILCIINPVHPDCPQPKTPVTPQSLCILNPSHPQCQRTLPTTPPLPTIVPSPLAGPKSLGGSQTPRILCLFNSDDPQCQNTLATTLGSQSPTLDLTRALTPSATPAPGSQLRSLTVTPTPTPVVNPTPITTTTPAPTPTPTLTPTQTQVIKCPAGSQAIGLFCYKADGASGLVTSCPEGYTGEPTRSVGGSLTGLKPNCTPITTTPTPAPTPTQTQTIKCPAGEKTIGLFCYKPGSNQLTCPEGYTGKPTTNVGGSSTVGPKPNCTPITTAPPATPTPTPSPTPTLTPTPTPTPTQTTCSQPFPNGIPPICYGVANVGGAQGPAALVCQNGKATLIPQSGLPFPPSDFCSGAKSPTTPTTTPTPPTPTVITNINNNQITVRDDGGLTVQDFDGAITTTSDCPPESATVLLGPSTMENGGARILAAFDPCVLADGEVVLNLPDEQGIQLVAANIVGGQTTQSVIVPMQRIAPITEGQTLYTVDLSRQITGSDPSTGNPVTLDGNVNSLFLLNDGSQEVELSGDNSVALNAVLS